ncbi:MAG: hypothetical protein QNJ47_21200 [Nostocaceae cyanobacterium]|nr:hypothetical protein [Nostocaceae cyanobacterium]
MLIIYPYFVVTPAIEIAEIQPCKQYISTSAEETSPDSKKFSCNREKSPNNQEIKNTESSPTPSNQNNTETTDTTAKKQNQIKINLPFFL